MSGKKHSGPTVNEDGFTLPLPFLAMYAPLDQLQEGQTSKFIAVYPRDRYPGLSPLSLIIALQQRTSIVSQHTSPHLSRPPLFHSNIYRYLERSTRFAATPSRTLSARHDPNTTTKVPVQRNADCAQHKPNPIICSETPRVHKKATYTLNQPFFRREPAVSPDRLSRQRSSPTFHINLCCAIKATFSPSAGGSCSVASSGCGAGAGCAA